MPMKPKLLESRGIPAFLLLLALLTWAGESRGASVLRRGTVLEPFDLERFDGQGQFALREHHGRILILDFFAYWCSTCRRASLELEQNIQRHYHQQGGNPNGIQVQVVSISIEKNQPEETRRFVKEVGAELVLNDPDGRYLESLGGTATPFIIILDGTQRTGSAPEFRVLHVEEGLKNVRKLRNIIDNVRGEAPSGAEIQPQTGNETPQTSVSAKTADLSLETLRSSDVQITAADLSYNQKAGTTEWKISVTRRSLALDYRQFTAFDFLGYEERIHEDYYSVQGGIKQDVGSRVKVWVGGGGYDGFADYRSLWIANYYKQQFNFVPGYETPSPDGFQANGGIRWEYLPGTGFVDVGMRYSNDTIAPGYEIDLGTGGLMEGRSLLHTYVPSLRFENVVSSRVRWMNEVQLTRTSGRDPRYAYQGSIQVALTESLVWRTSGGYTHEDPTLEAWYVGGGIDYALASRWHIGISGLYYKDTGEIENSLFVSTAAPGVRSRQIGLNLRYSDHRTSLLLSAGPVDADYQTVSGGTRPFTHLYRDRTWLLVQAAWNQTF